MSAIQTAALGAVPEGVRLRVRVRPGASRTAILGRTVLSDGEIAVRVAVSAPPEDGKANAAVIALLAKAWRVPKNKITIVLGATGRNKLLLVSGGPVDLMTTLTSWLHALPDA
jgi:uncharacterized protein (TIGR00251 family)